MKIIKITLILLMVLPLTISLSFAQKSEIATKKKDLADLQKSIQNVLQKTHTAGVGIVMINNDSVVWVGGLGKSDLENNTEVDENTMFRLGSVSKLTVSLAMLKLQEEGKLTLKDNIRDIIPEIVYDNPWEETHPITIEQLLEHTAGWSYWHMAELGSDDPKPKTLKEALEFYPKSRRCLYMPGTRIRESNVGTAVAAYIVEKVSGMRFEDYVDRHLFKPMGINNMTFFNSDAYKKYGASLYENGKKLDYFHVLYRPAAGLNASAKDMSKILELLINRGSVNGKTILSEASIQRMERNESLGNLRNIEPLKNSGCFNFADDFKGFPYREIGGSLPGGNAEIEYLPEYNLGYVVMINDGNENVSEYISYLIKEYQTQELEPKTVDTPPIKQSINIDPSGYYTIANAKIDLIALMERIKNIQKVWVQNDSLCLKNLMKGNSVFKFISVGNNEFQLVGNHPFKIAFVNDPLDGQMLVYGDFLKKISPTWAYCLLTLFWSFFIVVFTSVIFGFIGLLVYFLGKKKNNITLKISLWPMITNVFILLTFFIIKANTQTRYDMFQLFGTANLNSLLILLLGICYAVSSMWAVYYIFKNWRVKMARFFYFYFALAAIFNLIFSLYFLGNGLIGIPTWI